MSVVGENKTNIFDIGATGEATQNTKTCIFSPFVLKLQTTVTCKKQAKSQYTTEKSIPHILKYDVHQKKEKKGEICAVM